MNQLAEGFPDIAEAGDIYAGFAMAFRYPADEHAVLSQAEYLEAFDPGASNVAVSLHEATHADQEHTGLFEELVRFYEHFGLRRLQDAELPDHLSVELEFMHFLCRLEQHALARDADVDSLHRAQRDFMKRHLAPLIDGVSREISADSDNAAELVRSCAMFVAQHLRALSN